MFQATCGPQCVTACNLQVCSPEVRCGTFSANALKCFACCRVLLDQEVFIVVGYSKLKLVANFAQLWNEVYRPHSTTVQNWLLTLTYYNPQQ